VKLGTFNSGGITLAGSAGLLSTGLTAGTTATVATSSGTFGAGVAAVDLTSVANSQAALTTLDSAIDQITNSRASMGAYQNRLTATISNLETTSMNMQASRSRILDTDYAKETTNLAKSQIITQAATAMLAQANQSAQSVLALLK
jgi:flagellin